VTTKTFVISRLVLVAAGVMLSRPILAQSHSPAAGPAVSAYVDSIPQDLAADKTQVIKEAIQLNDKEAAAFWPVHKMYAGEQAKLDEERMQLVKRYSDTWTTLTDAEAKDLARQSLAFDSRRADLRNQYFDRFSQVLPGLTVAKFFQLEHRLDLLVDLKIASELPALLVR
jgi:hypothetical protein